MPSAKKAAAKRLNYSEECRGHARARHAGPTLAAGPSIDAYLKSRFTPGSRNGTSMSAFKNKSDQDRCVAFAFTRAGDVAHKNCIVSSRQDRTTIKAGIGGELGSITVRVVEKINGFLEGYDAHIREITMVVDRFDSSNEVIVTAYPSMTHRTR
jgi:hypothetical protein